MYLAAFTQLIGLKSFLSGCEYVIVYDNFSFLDRARDQALGSSRNMMQNLTTSLLLRCGDYPDD
jgi:hypothetical protein